MNSKPSILYVDDERSNLTSFKFQFIEHYNITTASSAEEGLECLRKNPAQVIISDQRMPGTTGVEFFEKVQKEFPDSLRMILTGYSNIDAVIDAINKGKIYYYFSKPWNENELKLIIDNAIEAQQLAKDKHALTGRYQAIVEDQTECIVRWWPNGNMSFANKTFIDNFQVDSLKLLDTSFPATIEGPDAASWLPNAISELPSGQSFKTEHCVQYSDVNTWYQWTHRPIYNELGDVQEFQSVGFDITQLKETQVALNEAKSVAEKANKAKDSFLAMMSHEMRTPLNPIMGFTSLLLSLEEELDKKEHLEVIMDSSQRLLALIDKILNYAQIENDKFSLDYERFPLLDFLKTTLSMMSTQCNENKLILDTPGIDPQTWIELDRGKLSQILINLISNACKFTHQGEINIQVRQTETPDSGSVFIFSVQDNGIGIEEEQLSHIFQPFIQIEDPFTRENGGLGLGLAISNKLLTAMGGSISVESKIREGSTFTFELPSDVINPNEITSTAVELNIREDNPSILIIEDDYSKRFFLKKLLNSLGAKVTLAQSTEDSITEFENKIHDLAIMDFNHPKHDGFKLFNQLKEIDSEIPIIAMSAHAEEHYKNSFLEAGFSEYKTKPITLQTISSLLTKWIPEKMCKP